MYASPSPLHLEASRLLPRALVSTRCVHSQGVTSWAVTRDVCRFVSVSSCGDQSNNSLCRQLKYACIYFDFIFATLQYDWIILPLCYSKLPSHPRRLLVATDPKMTRDIGTSWTWLNPDTCPWHRVSWILDTCPPHVTWLTAARGRRQVAVRPNIS